LYGRRAPKWTEKTSEILDRKTGGRSRSDRRGIGRFTQMTREQYALKKDCRRTTRTFVLIRHRDIRKSGRIRPWRYRSRLIERIRIRNNVNREVLFGVFRVGKYCVCSIRVHDSYNSSSAIILAYTTILTTFRTTFDRLRFR